MFFLGVKSIHRSYKSSDRKRKVLKRPWSIPVLIITPERSALSGEGAVGWVSDNHIWPKGHMPALIPNRLTS
jgi:hypothetical protein